MLAVWRESATAAVRVVRATRAAAAGEPEAARAAGPSVGELLRWAIRATTVWMMKDRAGTVGANGVAPLVDALQAAEPTARIHLVGHSFGAKVCLSAVAAGGASPGSRPVDSVLLLQPALSGWCFAPKLPDPGSPSHLTNRSGGYRAAVTGRVRQPVLTTFSDRDWLLHFLFDKFVRRRADIGEQPPRVLGIERPADPYLALGGFGPLGLGPDARNTPVRIVPFTPDPSSRYDFGAGGVCAIGLDGSNGAVTAHSDVNNRDLWWVLYNQVDQPSP